MGKLLDLATLKREQILAHCTQFGASEPRLFGSAVAGQETDSSDLDVLVRMPKTTSLFVVAALQQALADTLQREVDLVIEDELHPRIKAEVLRQARPL